MPALALVFNLDGILLTTDQGDDRKDYARQLARKGTLSVKS